LGSNVTTNPPRLVFGEQLGRRSPAGLILEIDIRKLLAGAVPHHKASVQFFDGPRRREAAGGWHHRGAYTVASHADIRMTSA